MFDTWGQYQQPHFYDECIKNLDHLKITKQSSFLIHLRSQKRLVKSRDLLVSCVRCRGCGRGCQTVTTQRLFHRTVRPGVANGSSVRRWRQIDWSGNAGRRRRAVVKRIATVGGYQGFHCLIQIQQIRLKKTWIISLGRIWLNVSHYFGLLIVRCSLRIDPVFTKFI